MKSVSPKPSSYHSGTVSTYILRPYRTSDNFLKLKLMFWIYVYLKIFKIRNIVHQIIISVILKRYFAHSVLLNNVLSSNTHLYFIKMLMKFYIQILFVPVFKEASAPRKLLLMANSKFQTISLTRTFQYLHGTNFAP